MRPFSFCSLWLHPVLSAQRSSATDSSTVRGFTSAQPGDFRLRPLTPELLRWLVNGDAWMFANFQEHFTVTLLFDQNVGLITWKNSFFPRAVASISLFANSSHGPHLTHWWPFLAHGLYAWHPYFLYNINIFTIRVIIRLNNTQKHWVNDNSLEIKFGRFWTCPINISVTKSWING